MTAAPGALAAKPAKAGCAGAVKQPAAAGFPAAERSVLCAVNGVRRSHARAKLRRNRALDRAARTQARNMIRQGFFDHVSPGGGTPVKRARAAGYLRGRAGAWVVAENLAWGTGDRSTAKFTVGAWMRSPGHRANMMLREVRDIGIAVVPGAPRKGGRNEADAAVYVIVLGRRS